VTGHQGRIVIFTDLDGTLLDHDSYSWEGANPALMRLKASGTPWVLCSSKTRAEIEPLREALGNRHPFIAENGGGLFIPRGYFTVPLPPHSTVGSVERIELGTPYPLLCRTLNDIANAAGVPVRGYGTLTAKEVAALTGLSLEEAERAKAREYDEPFIIGGEQGEGTEADRQRVLALIEAKGFRWTRGGRFHHLMGQNDKGHAVKILSDLYRTQFGSIITVGLGDSYNDLPMLAAVDRPILVKHPDGRYDPDIALAGLERADGIGPAGWNAAVLSLVADAASPD
jgi:mannosyl-3-phosphoglycerate phosphatase